MRTDAVARSRRLALLLVAFAVLAVAPPAAQAADTMTLAASSDPAEDRPVTFTASGTADAGSTVIMVVRRAGGAACADSADADVGGSSLAYASVGTGSYSEARNYDPNDPGDYLVCSWLRRDNETKAKASMTVSVRSNKASVALEVPATALPDQPVVVTARGTTEIRRSLILIRKPAGGSGCGSSSSTDAGGGSLLASTSVQGTFTEQRSSSFAAGSYLVCAWVQEGSSDLQPEATASATISVAPPDGDGDGVPDATDRCPTRPGPGRATGCPPRVRPAGLTATATPRRDRRRPYRFTIRGTLTPPAGVAPAEACAGSVSVQIKRGRTTISTRRRALRPDCTYSSPVRFSDRRRLGRRGRLKVLVRFLGNDALSPFSAPRVSVRAG